MDVIKNLPVIKKARVIAYYLPQYHPVPENDEWWGKGFTEWTNVGKARPLFRGHYQPRVPADLGYYDLRMPEVREAQANLARSANIEGFMYWHYWFGNGKRILERPFNEVLRSDQPDFPFCLGWANHSWTNLDWNSSSQWKRETHLIEQTYLGKEDFVSHFYAILEAFHDKRYITVDQKPIFLIYNPLANFNVREFIDIFNNLAVINGLPGVYFIGLGKSESKEILNMGFDAINSDGQWSAETTLKGNLARRIHRKFNKNIGGILLDRYKYPDIIRHLFNKVDLQTNVYPTLLSNWDRSPRSGRRAVIYTGSTPEIFNLHVLDALNLIQNKPDEHKILFLKSWNEWGEGNYIEPDLVHGHGYLNVLRDALKKDISSIPAFERIHSIGDCL